MVDKKLLNKLLDQIGFDIYAIMYGVGFVRLDACPKLCRACSPHHVARTSASSGPVSI